MIFRILHDLAQALTQEFGCTALQIGWEKCPEQFDGDLTVNCFRLAPVVRRNPMQIAERAAAFLNDHDDVRSAEQIKAFVNVTLEPAALFRDTVADETAILASALLPDARRRRVLIEYSAPNTNKPQHLGHVRNNCIGEAVTSLLRTVGHSVIPVNLVNDRGIHICKSMLAYQRWGNGSTPESAGVKGDHLVGDFYVMFDREYRRQVEALRQHRPELADRPDEELFLETEIGRAAQAMLVAWENDDPQVRSLWKTMNQWVLEGFDQTYRRMGVAFERVYLESETYTHGRDLVQEGLDKGIFHTRADGAVACDLEEERLGEKVVLRSDGTSVYVTQDLGTTVLKHADYKPDDMIWVVGDEQIYHFKVLFAILKRLGYEWADHLVHMAYGMVNLPSGKMKSREGTVVDADDLIDEMVALARNATLERAGETPPPDLDRRAEVIGLGALKFMLLRVNPETTMMFDPEASIRFEGDTGPYVQYACARISSMLRKAPDNTFEADVNWSVLGTAEEKDLAVRCAQYGDAMRRGAEKLDTSSIAGYLLDLAKSFSRFYKQCPVLSAASPELCRARLELSVRTRNLLRAGLNVLTIEALESM